MKKILTFLSIFIAFTSLSYAEFLPVWSVWSTFPPNLVKEKLHQKYPETKNIYCHDYRASYSWIVAWCSWKQFRLTWTDLANNNNTSSNCKKKWELISDNWKCCSWLTKIIPKTKYSIKRVNWTVIVEVHSNWWWICANVHDNICEINYENEFNSPNDCKYITTTSSWVIIWSWTNVWTGTVSWSWSTWTWSSTWSWSNTWSWSSTWSWTCIDEWNEISWTWACCNWLIKVPSKDSFNNSWSLIANPKYVCIKKWDNNCSSFENKFNSPDDCSNNSGSLSFNLIWINQWTWTLSDTINIKYNYKDSNNNNLWVIFKYSETQSNWKIINNNSWNIVLSVNSNDYSKKVDYWKNYYYNFFSQSGSTLLSWTFNWPSIPCKKEWETIWWWVYAAWQMPHCCNWLQSKPVKEAYNEDWSLKNSYDNICIKVNDWVCSSFENKFNSPNDCNNNSCIAEWWEVSGNKNCCNWLRKVFSKDSYNENWSLKASTKYICIKKWDNNCSSFENKFNSPDDCETNNEDNEVITLTPRLKEIIKNAMSNFLNNLKNSNLTLEEQINKLDEISTKVNRLKELKPRFTEISNFIYSELQDYIIILKIKKELMGENG